MAIFLEPGSTHLFRPDGPEGPVFYMRAPNEADRIKFQHAVTAAGGRYHTRPAMLAILKRGLRRIMDRGDELNFHLDAIAEAEAALAAEGEGAEAAAEDALLMLEPIETVVAQGDTAFASAIADNQVYASIVGRVVARQLVTGWDGLPRPHELNRQRQTSDAAMAALTDLQFLQLAAEGVWLQRPTEREAKNSGSPPQPSSGGETSTSSTGPT